MIYGDDVFIDTLKACVQKFAQTTPTSDFDLNHAHGLPLQQSHAAHLPQISAAFTRAKSFQDYKSAAVLIAFEKIDGVWRVWLTRRSLRLRHHPAQIAFPGGGVDPCDDTIGQTALREAYEEIGLPPKAAEIIGIMPPHITVSDFCVSPVIAVVRGPFTPRLDLAEVQEAFHIPAAHALCADNFYIQSRFWQGSERKYYTVPYGPYYIWGATARILWSLMDLMDAKF